MGSYPNRHPAAVPPAAVLDGTYVDLTTAQTVTGAKTFSLMPVLPGWKLGVLDPSGARFAAQQGSNLFEAGAYTDSTMNWGYNVSPTPGVKAVSAEPMMFVQMESKFRNNSGTPYGSEYHLNFQRPNVGGGLRRPINVFMEHVSDLVQIEFSADQVAFTGASGASLMNYGAGTWFIGKPVQLAPGAGAPALLTLGDALNSASLVMQCAAAGQVNSIEWKRGSTSKWLIYDAGSNDMYFRDAGNGRSHLQLAAGTTVANSYTVVNSSLWVNGNAGFYGTAPIAKQTLLSAATDAASTQALANDIRAKLVALGLMS